MRPEGYIGELFVGEQGAHITEVQQRLADSGQAVEVTGVFDESTQQALTEFAQANGGTAATNLDAVAQVQEVTGQLQSAAWVQRFSTDAPYGDQANLQQTFAGERYAGNEVWAGQQRDHTYYPDQQTASDEYGVDVQGGRVTIPGEVDAAGNPVYMDTVDIATQAGLAGSKPERMAYTMDAQGELRMVDPIAEQALHPGERVHHSTLAGGAAVAGAGEMKVREGTVEAVSDKSGHYKPDLAMTAQVADRLDAGGVDTSRVTFELGNYNDRGGAIGADTLVSGTELDAYDRTGILAELRIRCTQEAEAAARQTWGASTWDNFLPKELKNSEIDDRYAQLYPRFAAMDDRELYAEARKIIEGHHTQLRTLLTQIPWAMGWREDPLKRHVWRWWDGEAWTARVSDTGADGRDQPGDDPEGAQMLGAPTVPPDPDAAAGNAGGAAGNAAGPGLPAPQDAVAQQPQPPVGEPPVYLN